MNLRRAVPIIPRNIILLSVAFTTGSRLPFALAILLSEELRRFSDYLEWRRSILNFMSCPRCSARAKPRRYKRAVSQSPLSANPRCITRIQPYALPIKLHSPPPMYDTHKFLWVHMKNILIYSREEKKFAPSVKEFACKIFHRL